MVQLPSRLLARFWSQWGAKRAPTRPRAIAMADPSTYGTILFGLFSLAVVWVGAWYIAAEDIKRTEAAAYQDTANLVRAFEENIVRLIQASDQILLFARNSYSREPQHFD